MTMPNTTQPYWLKPRTLYLMLPATASRLHGMRCRSPAVLFVAFAALSFWSKPCLPTFAQPATAPKLDAIDTLRRATGVSDAGRPGEDELLRAILQIQQQRVKLNTEINFYKQLHGDGRDGGKRWRLVYLVTRNAVVSARKGVSAPSMLDRGWYVDGLVTAVQRFEDSNGKRVNQNGVFEFLGLGGFFFGYVARFKWPSPEKRTTMAFQPIINNVHAFGQDWSTPFGKAPPGADGDRMFDNARLQELNIFNFFYVDDVVAVAQGASGSVALWAATDSTWDEKHLTKGAALLDA